MVCDVKLLPRVKPYDPWPTKGLWVMDARTYDIPETIGAGIRNAAPGVVAITLSRRGGLKMYEVAQAAARERGLRIIWWTGPGEPLDPDYVRRTP